MHTTLDNAFEQLKLEDLPFHPRRGFEHTRGSETWEFYVVTRGHVPGIYTHWRVLHLFNSSLSGSPKHKGRMLLSRSINSKAVLTKSISGGLLPPARSITRAAPARTILAAGLLPPRRPLSTPPGTLFVKSKKPVVATPTKPRPLGDALPACTSAPSTPTASRKNLLYVYSRGNDTTIYASQSPTAARQGLADGSFRKVDVTSGVRSTFELAEDSALECYNISDFSDEE
ncbi:hypothetical protein B0H14DRAFT_3531789 [Mycena olivaceomarginata]|nr:hypothetical protein B0H14DRAFT_3531789 [Mycena olivaceomarginata]